MDNSSLKWIKQRLGSTPTEDNIMILGFELDKEKEVRQHFKEVYTYQDDPRVIDKLNREYLAELEAELEQREAKQAEWEESDEYQRCREEERRENEAVEKMHGIY